MPEGCPFLFPAMCLTSRSVIQALLAAHPEVAEIPDVRIHDLRHTFASLLVSGGASLEMIGRLLGIRRSGRRSAMPT